MKKYLYSVGLLLGIFVATAFSAGLGDTLDSVRAEYVNREFDEIYAFGNPPRAGRLCINTKGLFGAPPNSYPNLHQLFDGIRYLIPPDAVLTASYKEDSPSVKEIYLFKSKMLCKIPDIKKAFHYDKKYFNSPVGTFFIIVNYFMTDKDHIPFILVSLGIPKSDIEGMKKISKNPFN